MPRLVPCLALLCFACSGTEKQAPFDDGSQAAAVGNAAARLDYPPPPYGSTVGATIENFQFLGWEDPKAARFDTSALEPHSLAEFYDPKGDNGVQYLLVTSTAVWCSACRAEYQDMAGKVAGYEGRGARFLGALFENNDQGPASPDDLQAWAKEFAVTFPFVLDPELKFGAFFDKEATPMVMMVDTRHMTISSIDEGWSPSGPGSAWDYLDSHLR